MAGPAGDLALLALARSGPGPQSPRPRVHAAARPRPRGHADPLGDAVRLAGEAAG